MTKRFIIQYTKNQYSYHSLEPSFYKMKRLTDPPVRTTTEKDDGQDPEKFCRDILERSLRTTECGH